MTGESSRAAFRSHWFPIPGLSSWISGMHLWGTPQLNTLFFFFEEIKRLAYFLATRKEKNGWDWAMSMKSKNKQANNI